MPASRTPGKSARNNSPHSTAIPTGRVVQLCFLSKYRKPGRAILRALCQGAKALEKAPDDAALKRRSSTFALKKDGTDVNAGTNVKLGANMDSEPT
jgi:hypothetical protein